MLALLLAAAASLPPPADLPTVPRLIQSAQPVYCAAPRGNAFALTFDDGPSPYTPRLVTVLRRAHARATFFDVGSRVRFWPSAVRASARVGELGDHTWTHPYLTRLSSTAVRYELLTTRRILARMGGVTPRLFRPPYEQSTPQIERIARALDLLDVRWSSDPGDSRPGASPRLVLAAAVAAVRPGSIILLHDPHPTTAAVAASVLRAAARRGLEAVTVSDLLARQPPTTRQLASTGGARCPS